MGERAQATPPPNRGGKRMEPAEAGVHATFNGLPLSASPPPKHNEEEEVGSIPSIGWMDGWMEKACVFEKITGGGGGKAACQKVGLNSRALIDGPDRKKLSNVARIEFEVERGKDKYYLCWKAHSTERVFFAFSTFRHQPYPICGHNEARQNRPLFPSLVHM